MILGVGPGTFAILLAAAVAIVIAVVGVWLIPQATLPIVLLSVALPFIVLGCILSAPESKTGTTSSSSIYRGENPIGVEVVDTLFPLRVTLVLVMGLGMVGGIAFNVIEIMMEPPYRVPRMQCLRQQLEEAHPTWYR